MTEDKLSVLAGKQSCPVCGSISNKGATRCPECGTFHSGIHLEERSAPTPEERVAARLVDPSDYSINPSSAILEEEFAGDEGAVKSWSGGSTDFTFVDEEIKEKEEKKSRPIIPESEEVHSD